MTENEQKKKRETTRRTKKSSLQPPPLPLHTSNYAVIVSASKYWFNYRHNTNAILMYQLLKKNGYDDEHIIFMAADDYITNSRNPLKNQIYHQPGQLRTTSTKTTTTRKKRVHNDSSHDNDDGDEDEHEHESILKYHNSYASILDPIHTEIDYRGEDVTIENFVNVLTGDTSRHQNQQHKYQQQQPILQSNNQSNVFIYLTGHGGDEFFKFLDIEELLANQFTKSIERMYELGKYHELLIVADTCQAFTLNQYNTMNHHNTTSTNTTTTPNVLFIGSSLQGQSSYAHHADPYLGITIVERYTYHFMETIQKYMNKKNKNQNSATTTTKSGLQHSIKSIMIDPYTYQQQRANIGYSDVTSKRKIHEIPLQDFFSNVQVFHPQQQQQQVSSITTTTRTTNDTDDNTEPKIMTKPDRNKIRVQSVQNLVSLPFLDRKMLYTEEIIHQQKQNQFIPLHDPFTLMKITNHSSTNKYNNDIITESSNNNNNNNNFVQCSYIVIVIVLSLILFRKM